MKSFVSGDGFSRPARCHYRCGALAPEVRNPASREAAIECSPRRKPWVRKEQQQPAPKGRKTSPLDDTRATPAARKLHQRCRFHPIPQNQNGKHPEFAPLTAPAQLLCTPNCTAKRRTNALPSHYYHPDSPPHGPKTKKGGLRPPQNQVPGTGY